MDYMDITHLYKSIYTKTMYMHFKNNNLDPEIGELIFLGCKYNIVDYLTYPFIIDINEFENEFYRILLNIDCSNEEFTITIKNKNFPVNLYERWKRPWLYAYTRRTYDNTFYNMVMAHKYNILKDIDPVNVIKNSFNNIYYDIISKYICSDNLETNWKNAWLKYSNDNVTFVNIVIANELNILQFIDIKSIAKEKFNNYFYEALEYYVNKFYLFN